jgi:ankyrin repeat domain-containing protein 50
MQLLLYYGAIPDHACKQGASAIGISAQEGHEECVSVLLEYGANPLKSDHCGRTPYKLAAKSNRTSVLRILENHAKSELSHDAKTYSRQLVHFLDEHHPNLQLKSPDKPHEKSILQPSPNTPHNPNLLLVGHGHGNHATTSTQSSNFYENTMHSDTSSAKKRKSVISSQSTGSSNEVC